VLCLHIRRGIVYAVVGDVKSSASRSNLRLAPFLIQALQGWRRETPYAKPSDWIFAKPENEREEALTSKLSRSPAAELAKNKTGITTPVGWHTFRRSIATWLIENEENVKVTQEILRHRHVGLVREGRHADEAAGSAEDRRPTPRSTETQL
jgi:integrase